MSTTASTPFKSAAGTPERLFEFAGRFSVLVNDAVRLISPDCEWSPLLFLQLPGDELALSAVPVEHLEDADAINDFYWTYLPRSSNEAAHHSPRSPAASGPFRPTKKTPAPS